MKLPTPDSVASMGLTHSDDVAGARIATVADVGTVARLLHDFNTEFDTPTPGPAAIERRLTALLATDSTAAIVAGEPAVGVALITLRTNVWYDGPVALLDELYVVPELRDRGVGSAMIELLASWATERGVEVIEINVDDSDSDTKRFYRRHGFTDVDPDTGDTASYFYRAARD